MPQLTWVFGYGSLVWRPDFPFAERLPGVIVGWKRRFWQGSTDHRGVPGAPGRVVTLVEAIGLTCGGMAYGLTAAQSEEVLAHLDRREKGGYAREAVALQLHDGRMVAGLMYRALPGNPNWLGPADADAIARQVAGAQGPSGPNTEYVLRLAAALTELGFDDPHVRAIGELLSR